ncbi:MAG TPA: biotin carboxylase N-terminal domain-containing protein [Acidimicrobiales bacterium]
MFESAAISNRGEIAVRVINALRSMGIRSVAMYTDPDRDAPHVRMADSAIHIGGRSAYLDVDAVVSAALEAGAAALHPGYGFLSENPALAEACEQAGIVFVGPSASAIRAMGDKINAKRLVSEAGVPVVPGRDGRSLDDAGLAAAAIEIGLPVLLKPSAGGGGKGMHRVDRREGLVDAISAATREAIAAFGDGTLLVERYINRPRHIEVQVLADVHGRVVALGERECSLQRRHQKIVEESPSPAVDPDTRAAIEQAAISAAKSCGYVNAGTVEFIVSADRPDEFFFIEMNTRLQVEHPVTEMVRDLDLVECQLRIAAGEALPWPDQSSVPPARGHSVEARIYAEDPRRGFLPATGTVRVYAEPSATGVRVDSGIGLSSEVGTGYDPMLTKVIALGATRTEALAKLRHALADFALVGVTTNIGFLRRLLADPDVVSGRLDTGLVDRVQESLAAPPEEGWVVGAAAIVAELIGSAQSKGPWEVLDGWRIAGPAPRLSRWRLFDEAVEVSLTGNLREEGAVDWGAGEVRVRAVIDGDVLELQMGGSLEKITFAAEGDCVWISHRGDTWTVTMERETIDHAGPAGTGPGPVSSPMPGTVLAVHVKSGDSVRAGQPLVTVEAMKMEHVVSSQMDGTVTRVLVAPGESVSLGQSLAEVTEEAPA